MQQGDDTNALAGFLDRANSAAEYPGDAQIRGYGALSFLFLRTAKYQNASLRDLRRLIQPPIDLGFYKVFEVDGVPRAAVLWAFLGVKAERKLLTERQLAPSDWLSGTRMWGIEIVAPYGQRMGGVAMTWLRRTLPADITRVRYMRTTATNDIRHIVEVNRGEGGAWGAKLVSAQDILSIEGT